MTNVDDKKEKLNPRKWSSEEFTQNKKYLMIGKEWINIFLDDTRYGFNLKKCPICGNNPCFIRDAPVINWKSHLIIATHQRIFTEDELNSFGEFEIIGPDTLLVNWQKARIKKDYKKADEIKKIGLEMGFQVVFLKNHYQVHARCCQ